MERRFRPAKNPLKIFEMSEDPLVVPVFVPDPPTNKLQIPHGFGGIYASPLEGVVVVVIVVVKKPLVVLNALG